MIKDQKTGKAYINIWFGHFYCPAYNDEDFVRAMVRQLKALGFNSVMQDAKAWEDLAERFAGGEASQYVHMLEVMQDILEEEGMSHEFLALYLNGDNLYPNIRFSPPIYGESVVDEQGNDGRWYRYWSDKAKESQEAHVRGLLKTYGENHTEVCLTKGEKDTIRRPICGMWDPIVAPSFDAEGRQRYLTWLAAEYGSDIARLNEAYGTGYGSFDEMEKEDYWFSCRYPGQVSYTKEELDSPHPRRARQGAPLAGQHEVEAPGA